MPFQLLQTWIQEEKDQGAPNPQQAVLSTVTKAGLPHSRVVAIREIGPQGIVFFTQKGSRKVDEIQSNPNIGLVFWFELTQREVILEAQVRPLTEKENKDYWSNYPKEAQLRFLAYAPTSSKPIDSKQLLEDKKSAIELAYRGQDVPYTPLYCGFRILPHAFVFYHYRSDELSDVFRYVLQPNTAWQRQCMSP